VCREIPAWRPGSLTVVQTQGWTVDHAGSRCLIWQIGKR